MPLVSVEIMKAIDEIKRCDMLYDVMRCWYVRYVIMRWNKTEV